MRLINKLALTLAIMGASLMLSAAEAEDNIIALPEIFDTQKGDVVQIITKEWFALKRDTSLIVLNGHSGHTIATIDVPDKSRYDLHKFIEKDFRLEKLKMGHFVQSLNEPEEGKYAAPLNIPTIVQAIGRARGESTDDLHVAMLGNPLLSHPRDPGISMIGDEGVPQIPSDGFLVADKRYSPYGQGADDPDLVNVTFHLCADLPDYMLEAEKRDLARFWFHYLDMRGGKLATFTNDIQGCMASYAARNAKPLTFSALDAAAPLEMKRLNMKTAPKVTITDPRDGAYKEVQLRQEQERQACEDAKDVADEINGLKENGVTSFSRFTSVPHPTLSSFNISTGVSYDAGEFPKWKSSFCFFSARNDKGSNVSIDVGIKKPGETVIWETISKTVLKDVSLSERDIKKARKACRFPEDAQ